MSVNAVTTGGKRRWKVRWREGTQQRSKTFDRKEDAKLYDAEGRAELAVAERSPSGFVTPPLEGV
jgi:hypothetical protein